MIHGESIVMRVLDKSAMVFDLNSLGMSEAIYSKFSEIIDYPHGIVLVTGPTGSGKTPPSTVASCKFKAQRQNHHHRGSR